MRKFVASGARCEPRECSCPRPNPNMLTLASAAGGDLEHGCGTRHWAPTWPACQSSKSFWRHWNSLGFHMTVHTCHNQSHLAAIIMHQLSAKLGACEHSLLPQSPSPLPQSRRARLDLSIYICTYMHIDGHDCKLRCLGHERLNWYWYWISGCGHSNSLEF